MENEAGEIIATIYDEFKGHYHHPFIMCFHAQQSKSAQELKNRFKVDFESSESYAPAIYNGFQFPKTPLITNKEMGKIQLFHWGLIPYWAKDLQIRKHTLNARIESIHEKPSFKNVLHNRCLILSDGFFEWQWLDEKGKQKQKYLLSLAHQELFAFAGLFSEWFDKDSGATIHSYTILTTEANELMSSIHNTKKRMPMIVAKDQEQAWLEGKDLVLQNELLIAEKI